MKDDVCAAHGLLVDNVRYIRRKQDETAETVQEVSLKQTALTMKMENIESTQQEILKLLRKKKWTPAKVAGACAAVFGSGSAFPPLVTMFIEKVIK